MGPPPPFNPDEQGRPGPNRPGPDRPPGGPPGLNFLSSEMRFNARVVKGAPFTADVVTEHSQMLADGTRITRSMTAQLSRDSEGRMRRAQQIDNIGPFQVSGEPLQLVFIDDPVAGVHYVLNLRDHTARRFPSRPGEMPGPPPREEAKEAVESLGTQNIEGVAAQGTRSTITIPAGSIGNDRPINIISEKWEAPDLQLIVLSRHSDPRVGVTEYRLTGINRSEPARSLFEVPADFTLVESGPPFMPEPGRDPKRKPRRQPDLF